MEVKIRIRDWSVVFIYTALIYLTLPITPNIWKFFRGRIGNSLDYFPAISLIIIGIFIISYLVFYRKHKNPFTYTSFILIAFAYRYGLSRIKLPIEKIHFIEYGFLSFLVFKALRSDVKNNHLLYSFSALIVFCLGFMDEGIQYLLPNRVYEFRDVMLNATSGVLGLCVVAFLFKSKGKISNRMSILVIRTDRFGEFLLNIPAIRALREKFPSSHIAVMVHPSVREIIEGNPIVDEIISYNGEKEQRGFLHTLKFIMKLRKKRFDLAVILNPAKKFNLITFLAGIHRRVGYNRKWGFLLTDKIENKKYFGEKHEVEYNLDLVRKIGADTQDKSLFIPMDSKDEEFVKNLLAELGVRDNDSLIAIHPWTSNPKKQWPKERFAEVGDRLIEELGVRVVVIGGDDEVEVTSKFCNSMRNLPINLCAKLSLRQLAAFLRYCKLLISNDSGPVHVASAVKTPTVVIFGGSDPGTGPIRWGPWGEGHAVIYKNSLETITLDEVFKLVRDSVSNRKR